MKKKRDSVHFKVNNSMYLFIGRGVCIMAHIQKSEDSFAKFSPSNICVPETKLKLGSKCLY